MNYKKGETYNLNHNRKGKFSLKVEHDDGEFLTGLVTKTEPGARVDEGEEVTVRKEFVSVRG